MKTEAGGEGRTATAAELFAALKRMLGVEAQVVVESHAAGGVLRARLGPAAGAATAVVRLMPPAGGDGTDLLGRVVWEVSIDEALSVRVAWRLSATAAAARIAAAVRARPRGQSRGGTRAGSGGGGGRRLRARRGRRRGGEYGGGGRAAGAARG